MTGDEIRKRFVAFFEREGHTPVASSSLVPQNDPTLLFTNAGMNQFKALFLGQEHREYKRAVSSQKCVRAGGKHNDLENVGRTARHHTFFEMLGNFSFGDYFKAEAIPYAWEFVTQELALPAERLLVTVYAEDDEAYEIWRHIVGLPAEKVIRIDTNDNFWSMGPTGPCGPCSEIFYDYGPEVAGGPPGSAEQEGDRFVEIWNLVFMQFDRAEDGTMTPLPNPCIDTGAGLERIASILQGKTNNYDTDLFQPLIQAAAQAAQTDPNDPQSLVSLRVIADHLRSVSFLIADGVLPSNEGRGYVLRRIMRRAMRHGRLLGLTQPFLYKLVPVLVKLMSHFFPELAAQEKSITLMIEIEEKRFVTTLGSGLKLLEEAVAPLSSGDTLVGSTVFSLYDTYGFPVDLTADILKDRGINLDMDGFDALMTQQRLRARAAWSGSGDEKVAEIYQDLREKKGAVEFLGYSTLRAQGRIVAIINQAGESVNTLPQGSAGQIITNQTPFYGESGGQVGDKGVVLAKGVRFEVDKTTKPVADLVVLHGKLVSGALAVGQEVAQEVDGENRRAVSLHHSATHYLHHALRTVLGEHVKQAGSLVTPERLRFDFSHYQAVTAEELAKVEAMVNAGLLLNSPQETVVMTPEEAVEAGAMALFGEKYGEQVRVVRMGETMELCGGTHVSRSGDIGLLRILSESAIAAGMRRIEAVCGPMARKSYLEDVALLKNSAQLMKIGPADVVDGVQRLLTRQKELERELEKAQSALSGNLVNELALQVEQINGTPLLVQRLDGADPKGLRELVDRLLNKLGSAVVFFGIPTEGKVSLVAGVSKDLTSRIKAGDLIRLAAPLVGGKGGGRPDLAQGGGSKPEQLNEALAAVKKEIEESVS
ncbi:MAG: alanine--tRNA ligase [Magnetococcales bacterium]|nr:alanine--tRNA ligase [Magnetococcales bacterium]